MKKYIFSAIALAAVMFTSCDMDLKPDGSIIDTEAMTDVTAASYFRNGFYSSLRSVSTGGTVTLPDIQADKFIGVIINGNRLGTINNGQIFSNDGDLGGCFAGMYSRIASINNFLPQAQALIDGGVSEEELDYMHRYMGEARFCRAYYYYYLVDHFCQSYTPAIGDKPALGMPLVTTYNPTAVQSTYPGRSTLNETFKQIEADLDSCYNALAEFEAKYEDVAAEEMLLQNASYLSTYAVRALQARLALLKQDWQKAYDYANEIYSSKKYPLITRASNYSTLWNSDMGTEVIFRPYADLSEAAGVGSTGGAWISSYEDKADYVCCSQTLEMYATNDSRYNAFFAPRVINVYGVDVTVPSFVKYPGNPTLNLTNTNALKNIPKMFRTSEMVLIMAEAAYRLGNEEDALDALNLIRKARIPGYKTVEYNGDELLSEIKLERTRELIGEGFRISDLRRWGEGFTRSTNYSDKYADTYAVTVVAGRSVEYIPNDHRYVWPIPSMEMQTNPQLAGQQNPGY